jgi:hypothetical protein
MFLGNNRRIMSGLFMIEVIPLVVSELLDS